MHANARRLLLPLSILLPLALGAGSARADLPFTAGFQSFDVGSSPQVAVLGDWNADGYLDAVTATRSGIVTALLGRGDGTFGTRTDYALGGQLLSVAAGDLNGDGIDDLAITESTANRIAVMVGAGDGTFRLSGELQTGARPDYVEIGDLNGDGNADMAVANEVSSSASVFLGHGDTTFEPRRDFPAGLGPCYIAIADFDEDGHPDLATANEPSNTVSLLFGNGDGTFRAPQALFTGLQPRSVTVGDLNGDGHLDIVAPDFLSSDVAVLLGNGTQLFQPKMLFTTGLNPWSVAIADLNRDGHPDLVTANVGSNSVSSLLGRGDGSFEASREFPAGRSTRFVATGDLDRDGIADLVAANEDAMSLTVHHGNGDGTFGSLIRVPAGDEPVAMAQADFNLDGHSDLAVAQLGSPAALLLFGDGVGSFVHDQGVPTLSPPTSIASADVDGDGTPDLLITTSAGTSSGALSVYRGRGDGMFFPQIDTRLKAPSVLAGVMDVNRDGIVDAVIVSGGSASALLGDGAGAFTIGNESALGGLGGSAVLRDIDGDGGPDLVVLLPDEKAVAVLHGAGDGAFTPLASVPLPEAPGRGLAVADWNHDGWLDLAVTLSSYPLAEGGSIEMFLGRGDGNFDGGMRVKTGLVPTTIVALDWNLDGRLDLAVPNVASNTVSLYRGGGDGSLERIADLGTGGAPTSLAVGDWNGDGGPDLVTTDLVDGTIGILLNRTSRPLVVRAFPEPGDRVLRLFEQRPSACIRVEPVSGSYSNEDVDLSTLRLHSAGTGLVDEISARQPRRVVVEDRDRNGVDEIAACFAMDDLRHLFSKIRGRRTVPIVLTAHLRTGRTIRAEFALAIVGAGLPPRVVVSPNPLNPEATFTIETPSYGPLTVRLFDATGRLVRTLVDLPWAEPGTHRVRMTGHDDGGRPLATGIYFYRLDMPGQALSGRVAILK